MRARSRTSRRSKLACEIERQLSVRRRGIPTPRGLITSSSPDKEPHAFVCGPRSIVRRKRTPQFRRSHVDANCWRTTSTCRSRRSGDRLAVSRRPHAASRVRGWGRSHGDCDVACGYAAMTLMPSGAWVLTVEYKVNFLSPAQGERMLARGRVIRPGRTVTVCGGDVLAVRAGEERLVATMLATMATVRGESRNVPPSTPPTAHEHRLGVHRSPGSWRQARPWCVCRGGKLRQRLRHFSEVRSSSGE
jgi:hypothetical protein